MVFRKAPYKAIAETPDLVCSDAANSEQRLKRAECARAVGKAFSESGSSSQMRGPPRREPGGQRHVRRCLLQAPHVQAQRCSGRRPTRRRLTCATRPSAGRQRVRFVRFQAAAFTRVTSASPRRPPYICNISAYTGQVCIYSHVAKVSSRNKVFLERTCAPLRTHSRSVYTRGEERSIQQ